MKRFASLFPRTPDSRAARAALALSCCALALGACVSAGEHESLANQLELARAEVQRLEITARSLEEERASLLEEAEESHIERRALRARLGELQRALGELEQARGELSETLRARESELEKRRAEVERLRSTYDTLVGDLQSEVAAGRVEIEQLRDGLKVKLAQAILFASGSAQLSAQGDAVVRKLAERFLGLPHQVDVEGHSDDVPLRAGARYRTNWELAAARAASVVQVLASAGVPDARLRVISHAHTRPVAEGASEESRARNRRIEIRLRNLSEGASAP